MPESHNLRTLKLFLDKLVSSKIVKNASKIIALSRFEADQYKHVGVPEDKIAIIPNGIDLSGYANLPPKGAFKRKFGIPEEKKIILYLGRIHKTKGIDFLIKAYAHLINDTHHKDALLVIAGPDDGYLKEVKSLAQKLGISSSILFTGLLYEDDKVRAYIDSDVIVNVEPFNVYGLVPLEATVCSKPVIVSKTNAISEVVATGKFGYSVKYGSVTSLAFRLHQILNNGEMAEKLGRNGQRYVFNNLSWDKIIERYELVYREVAK
jgi:glycosyltransferase involved in cell wall biosynthesis